MSNCSSEKGSLFIHPAFTIAKFDSVNLFFIFLGPERRKSTEQSLDCPVCLVRLPNLELKKDHVQSVHHNLRTIECGECPQGTIFHSQMHLKAHQMASHMNSAFSGWDIFYCNSTGYRSFILVCAMLCYILDELSFVYRYFIKL